MVTDELEIHVSVCGYGVNLPRYVQRDNLFVEVVLECSTVVD